MKDIDILQAGCWKILIELKPNNFFYTMIILTKCEKLIILANLRTHQVKIFERYSTHINLSYKLKYQL